MYLDKYVLDKQNTPSVGDIAFKFKALRELFNKISMIHQTNPFFDIIIMIYKNIFILFGGNNYCSGTFIKRY